MENAASRNPEHQSSSVVMDGGASDEDIQWEYDPWGEFKDATYGAPATNLVKTDSSNLEEFLSGFHDSKNLANVGVKQFQRNRSRLKESSETGATNKAKNSKSEAVSSATDSSDSLSDSGNEFGSSSFVSLNRFENIRKRGLFGPHRQKPRKQRLQESDEKLYDRIPSYYTMFSLPNRTATGVKIASVIPPLSRKKNAVSTNSQEGFDKLPSYFSCFTNSTAYDEDNVSIAVPCQSESLFGSVSGTTFGGTKDRARERAHSPQYSVDLVRPRMRPHRRGRPITSPTMDNLNESNVTWHEDFLRSPRRRYSSRGDRKMRRQMTKRETYEKRHILYIGCISAGYTNERLRQQFGRFGEIETSSVHFRETGDNYAFVTYKYMSSAIEA